MTKPRLLAILSAIGASTVTFLVVRRWHLAGTLTGAALVPVISTLVAHVSSESLHRAGGWARHKLGQEAAIEGTPANEAGEGDDKGPSEGRANTTLLWKLGVIASLTVGVSALLLTTPSEKTVIRERVIEKTVTVTVPTQGEVARTPAEDSTPDTTTKSSEPVVPPTTETTTTPSDAGAADETSSSSTTEPPQEEVTGTTEATGPATTLLP